MRYFYLIKMNLRNIKEVEEKTEHWVKASRVSVRANYRRMIKYLKNLNKLEEKGGNYYTTATLKEIHEFIIKVGSISSYQSITIRTNDFSRLFTEVLEIPAKFSNIPPTEIVKTNEGIYNKEEIVAICNQFINAQDRFIIYSIWYGLKDSKFEDITAIKVSDVDFDNNIVKVGKKEIEMDDVLKTYISLSIEEDTYFKLGDITDTNGSYSFNMNNPYIVKPKPQSNNNYGAGRMTSNGLRTRINNLNYSLEDYGITLKSRKLYTGGVIYKMHEESKKYGTVWNNSTIKDFKEKHDISAFSIDTLLAYKNKYN